MTRRVQTKLLLRRSGGLLPAVTLLKAAISELKIRMVNAVDLMRLQPAIEHPHGLSDEAFDALFTRSAHPPRSPIDRAFARTSARGVRICPIREWRWPDGRRAAS